MTLAAAGQQQDYMLTTSALAHLEEQTGYTAQH
jgi:hypothetical protein